MTTWDGWATDFLAAAKLQTSAANVKFVEAWAANADSPSCGNNPVDLSAHEPGSKPCGPVRKGYPRARAYTSHRSARAAFVAQFRQVEYSYLRSVLESSTPYSTGIWEDVAANLTNWGSTVFANIYLAEMEAKTTGVGSAAATHRGWAGLQKTFNTGMPTGIKHARRAIGAGLHSVRRARKVKL